MPLKKKIPDIWAPDWAKIHRDYWKSVCQVVNENYHDWLIIWCSSCWWRKYTKWEQKEIIYTKIVVIRHSLSETPKPLSEIILNVSSRWRIFLLFLKNGDGERHETPKQLFNIDLIAIWEGGVAPHIYIFRFMYILRIIN